MSTTSKQFRVLERDGTYSYISRKRAKECIAAKSAVTVRTGVIQFVSCPEPVTNPQPPRQRLAWGPAITVIPASASDSGQAGFLRYPMPWGVSSQPKYPALARKGAGL